MEGFVVSRMEMAIMTILFETFPLSLSKKEIKKRIEEKGLLEMSKEEFEEYMDNVVKSKQN